MNDLYIRMVLALPQEFFEGWQWIEEDGTKFWLTDDSDEWYVPSDAYQAYTIIGGKLVSYVVDPEDWIFADLERGRPLPTQKQLQDILLTYHNENFGFMTELQALFYWFWHWVTKQETTKNGFQNTFTNFDQLWLAFTQYTLHGESWDGEKWI